METSDILADYEAVASITGQMLLAARDADWDRLTALESACAARVAILKEQEPQPALTGALRERKVRILRQILDDDREIRNLTEPWMARLMNLMQSAGTERRLSRAYRGG
ncbi:MAG: flagellar protein FliT [Burkholderiaceae bacterium]